MDNSNKNTLSKTEQVLFDIWKVVLEKNDIDINKSFFVQGGNSIGVTKICREIEKKYPGVVKVSDCFKYFSISKLAGFIDSKIGNNANEEKKEEVKKASEIREEDKLNDVLCSMEDGELSVEDALSKLLD